MIFFIISLTYNYSYGIIKLKYLIDYYKIENFKIIINSTFNNFKFKFEYKLINIQDKLKSLIFVINYFDIKDEDFIVKLNGNYLLKSKSPFMNYLSQLDKKIIDVDVISKYYFDDLFGMRCKFIKKIENNNEKFDLRLEKAKSFIEEKKQIYLEILGIDINQNPNLKSKFTIY
jgi:hypothetical protein